MNKIVLTLISVIFLSGAISVFAQVSTDEQKAAEQKWMAYMTPGSVHEKFAKSAGEWSCKMEMWMAPGTEPATTEGTVKAEMILGGRYLQMKYNSIFMGMPYEGISLDGYDNAKKVYFNTWIDNMGTGIMYSEGICDDKTKTINYTGKMFDPLSGKNLPYRQTVQTIDDKHMVMEMFYASPKDGKEFKSMHVEYSKK
jgi:hypothetical protein